MRSDIDDVERDDHSQHHDDAPPIRVTDPPVYGNFQRYYHIRNPVSSTADLDPSDGPHPALAVDSRVSTIVKYLGQHYAENRPGEDVKVLDIGCNSGKVTIEIAQTLPRLFKERWGSSGVETRVEISGADIDPSLIRQAKAAADVARSRCRPDASAVGKGSEQGQQGEQVALPADSVYFPSVFPSLYGCIPPSTSTDPTATEADHLFPPALTFLTANFVQPHPSTAHLLATRFHLVLALSITKWVHIQFSDVGLLKFFARIALSLLPGGLLFLERQEWTSYHSAKNLDPTIKAKIKRLKLRPGGDFDWWLETFGLQLEGEVGQGRGVGFERPVQVFRRVQGEERLREYWARTPLDDLEMVPWVARSGSSVMGRASASAEGG